jgi:serine/threonine protein kinase
LIEIVARALEGSSGVLLEPARDYRGVPTVGAWRWLPNYGFGVATKIDAREAYRPLGVARTVFVVLFLLLVLAAIVIFLFSYMQVVWRQRIAAAELKAGQLGQYRLEEQIGAGGMGVVYRAHHALLRRDTALKLLPPDKADPDAVRRFEREVRLTCRLTHPNTIQVYDYGHTPDGIFYYAMEYLDGLTLAQLVELYGPQTDGRVVHILSHVCESLQEAHALGLIHRDIKPANIFVCDRGGVPDTVKVVDFGLVKFFGESTPHTFTTTKAEHLVGTPNYIAPESLKDPNQCDARSDLYSLGAVGYFLLTGRPLFDGGSFIEVCQKHLTEEPVPPSARLGRAVCPCLEAAIMSCLRKDPAARPASAKDLAAALVLSPALAEWNEARKTAWWQQQRLDKTKLGRPPSPPSRPLEATVRIEFSDRTV